MPAIEMAYCHLFDPVRTNGEGSDKTLRSAASDLDLHYSTVLPCIQQFYPHY